MRLLGFLLLAACTNPAPPPPAKPAPITPPPAPLPRCDNGNSGELRVYRARDELPPEAAAKIPDDFDFTRFELAGPAALQPGRYRIIPVTPWPCAGGRKIFEDRTCGHGRQEPPEPPVQRLWQIPRAEGSVWYELLLQTQTQGCAP